MIRPILFAGASFALIALGAGSAAATDLVVVEAHGVKLAAGASVDGSKPLSLQEGQDVTLLASTGQIVKLQGPSNATPDSQVKSGSGDEKSAVTALLTQQDARTSEVGVVRGEKTVKLPNPWVIDVTHPGTSCIVLGQPVVLWRSEDLSATSVSIAPADRSWNVAGQWPQGADQIQMPPNLPLKDQTSYVINVGGKPAPVTLRLIPKTVGNDLMRASWMSTVGCSNQASALLTTLQK